MYVSALVKGLKMDVTNYEINRCGHIVPVVSVVLPVHFISAAIFFHKATVASWSWCIESLHWSLKMSSRWLQVSMGYIACFSYTKLISLSSNMIFSLQLTCREWYWIALMQQDLKGLDSLGVYTCLFTKCLNRDDNYCRLNNNVCAYSCFKCSP